MQRVRVRIAAGWWKKPVFIGVGLIFLGWLLKTPPGLLGKADAIGYAVCHRIDLRSFYLGDRQLPLCARCTGMYLGAMLGLAYLGILAPRKGGLPSKKLIVVLGILVAAFALDGINSFLSFFPGVPTLYQPQNWLRLLTGTGMGLVIAIALYPAFNQTVWKDWQSKPALEGMRSFVGLLLLAGFLDLLVLSGNPLILYPLALISAAGVLVLLTMVYSMFCLMVFRAENAYIRLHQLLLPLTAGFGLAILQIAVLDFARYMLTGTWNGFHLG
jgi:uncharacterized membrane protein